MTVTVAPTARASVLISPQDAVRALDSVFLEVSREPLEPSAARIAGAQVAVLTPDLAGDPSPDGGRFPLPDPDRLAATLTRWGIRRDTSVVVAASTPADSTIATRAWFVLRWAGIDDVRVLDGGAGAWVAAGGSLGSGPASSAAARGVPSGVVGAKPSLSAVPPLDADGARDVASEGVLIDARPESAFERGRIPGAVNAPGGALFRDGRLLPDEELRRWAEALGAAPHAPVAAYCGGGVAASATVFALHSLGIPAGLYVGSWSAWSADSGRPVER